MVRPAGDEPFHVRRDRVDVLYVLLGGVRVVHAEVALTVELAGDAEVQAYRLGVADVQVAVRLRWKTCHHAADAAGGQVLLDHLPEKVLVLLPRLMPRRGFGFWGCLVLVHVRVRHDTPAARVIAAPHLVPAGIKASFSHNPPTESRPANRPLKNDAWRPGLRS